MALNNTDLENASNVTALRARMGRAMWLRAAILGANDGLISTASLMLGIGAASSNKEAMIISGIAGALAGACSMAVGEFVSVSTQRDIEKSSIDQCVADVKLHNKLNEGRRLQGFHDTAAPEPNVQTLVAQPTEKESESGLGPEATFTVSNELHVLTYVTQPTVNESESSLEATEVRSTVLNKLDVQTHVTQPTMKESGSGLEATEARSTALQDDKQDMDTLTNPYKAAGASALSFLCGALLPIASTIVVSSSKIRFIIITVVTTISLIGFGGLGAFLGGSPIRVSAMRAVLGGWISMAISYGLLKAYDGADKKFQL